MPVVELDLEHGVREGLEDLALHLDLLFLGHRLVGRLDGADVHRLGTLVAGLFLVLHLRVLGQRLEALPVDAGVVHEEVTVAVVWRDEAVALFVVEPLDGSGRHLNCPFLRVPGRSCVCESVPRHLHVQLRRPSPTLTAPRYQGRAAERSQLPSKVAFPGPCARKLSTACCRSFVSNSRAPIAAVTSSAPRTRSSRNARTIRFVAWCALVGPAASRCANRSDFSSSSESGRTRLTTFQRSSVAASYRPPPITSSRARAGPARSAIRCVPPISGVRPITASTRPNWADSAAQITSHASDSSRPAVRQRPCTDASVGNGSSSILCVIASSPDVSCAAPDSDSPLKTFTSTPPVKYLPSARTRR